MKVVEQVAMILVLVGALNWGLVGALNFNLVETLLGMGSMLSMVVYILVGVSALWVGYKYYMGDESCKSDSTPAAAAPSMSDDNMGGAM